MKHKPHKLPYHVCAAVLAVSAAVWFQPAVWPHAVAGTDESSDAAPTADNKGQQQAPPPRRSGRSADEVFAAVVDKLESAETLSCDLVETILLSGNRFVAMGSYQQAPGNRFRLQHRIYPVSAWRRADAAISQLSYQPQVSSDMKPTGTLLQVSDGSVLWTYWINGTRKTLTRRNINEVLAAAEDVPDYSQVRMLQDLGVGGLKTLVTRLRVGMEFGAVLEQTIGEQDFLILTGRWDDTTRREIFGQKESTETPLPDYLPEFVRVYVESSTMLPRRVQYLKKHGDEEKTKVRPLVTLDLRNLKMNIEIPDDTFVFQRPGDKDVEETDMTAQVIESLKQLAQLKKQAAAGDESDQNNTSESTK